MAQEVAQATMFSRPWLALAVFLASGVALGRWLPAVPAWALAAPGAALLVAAFFPLAPARQTPFCRQSLPARLRRGRLFAALAFFALAAGAGAFHAAVRALAPGEAFAAAHAGAVAAAEVELLAMPEAVPGGAAAGDWQAPARLLSWGGRAVFGVSLQLYGSGRLSGLCRGARLDAPKLRIYPPLPPAWPGAFSPSDLQRQSGLGGAARVVGRYAARGGAPQAGGWRGALARGRAALDAWRTRGVMAFRRLLPDRRGAFMAAVVFGWTEGLPPALAENFRCSGLGHVLAISGLHVGLVAGLAWLVSGLFLSGRRLRAAAALAFVVFFVLISGARPSAVRAGAVAVLYFGGVVCARRASFLDSLGLAAIFLLASDPWSLFSVGFQFSFIAVLFIYCLGAEVARWWENAAGAGAGGAAGPVIAPAPGPAPAAPPGGAWRRLGLWAAGLFGCSLAAWLGTWPLVAYYFNLCSYGGLLVNAVSVPLLTLALCGAGAELLISPWAGAGLPGWLPWALALPAEGMARLADLAGEWRGGWATALAPPRWLLAAYYGLFALFFARRALGKWGAALKICHWAAAFALAGVGVLIYTFSSTLAGNPLSGVYALETGRRDVFCVVSPGRRLTVAVPAAPRSWAAVQGFVLWLGFREVDCLLLGPGSEPGAVFLRRLPCREVARARPAAGAPWRHGLPGGGEAVVESAGRGAAWWLREGRAVVLAGRSLRDDWLAAAHGAERARAAGAACFLRATALRRFAGLDVWHGPGCPGAGPRHRPRGECGYVFVDRESGKAAGWRPPGADGASGAN